MHATEFLESREGNDSWSTARGLQHELAQGLTEDGLSITTGHSGGLTPATNPWVFPPTCAKKNHIVVLLDLIRAMWVE